MDEWQSDFARVYRDHVWRVYGFVAYRVRDHAVAEDLTQATFERALRAWSRFDSRRGSETAWMLAIARNVVIDHHRRDKSGRLVQIDERVLPALPGPEERLTGSSDLTAALNELSDRDREVIALRFGADLAGAEIAALLDLSLANVQQIISRSLKRLRAVLEAEALQGSGRAERSEQEQQQSRR
jgi:RNA polymerase sigma-70 factor, ECF subfamily